MKKQLKNLLTTSNKSQTQGAIWGNIADMFSQVAGGDLQPQPTLKIQSENASTPQEVEDLQAVLQRANSSAVHNRGQLQEHKPTIQDLVTYGLLYLYNTSHTQEAKEFLYGVLKRRQNYEAVVSYDIRKRHKRQARERARSKSN
ncbi:hypothetical protein BKI52_12585 [marine bacterium AO1-C]|nr:hypothetical protein BKI52_12585 [marine bacterium AO1-C]